MTSSSTNWFPVSWRTLIYIYCAADVNARCPLTGERLKGWITIETNDGLRRRIAAWANKHKFNLELISSLSNSQRKQRARPFPSLPPTCTQCKQGMPRRFPCQCRSCPLSKFVTMLCLFCDREVLLFSERGPLLFTERLLHNMSTKMYQMDK